MGALDTERAIRDLFYCVGHAVSIVESMVGAGLARSSERARVGRHGADHVATESSGCDASQWSAVITVRRNVVAANASVFRLALGGNVSTAQ